ncbi:MAG: hypothetical protein JSW34_13290 [Candidatus Zixiibacteriota bacterium]|nr:MAG: hypothetical protein JSW34_13290 [candidate division Zixibacteria bacterium]
MTQARRNRLGEAERHLLNDRFAEAHEVLDSLVALRPADPVGHVFKAAVYLGEMTATEANLYPAAFFERIDTAVALAEGLMSDGSGRQQAWMHLFLGHAAAYRALWESRFGSFTSALRCSFEARSHYEDGLAADSTLYDLYAGLGVYHYWKSAKAGILRWLGIFKDDKEKGIRQIRMAADSSQITGRAARNALIWIWLDQKQYDSVIAECRSLLQTYPDGRLFFWPLAAAYFESGAYDPARGTFLTLRGGYARAPGNYYNLVECDYFLYQCLDKLERKSDAKSVAVNLLAYYENIPDDTRRRQRGKIAFLRRAARR